MSLSPFIPEIFISSFGLLLTLNFLSSSSFLLLLLSFFPILYLLTRHSSSPITSTEFLSQASIKGFLYDDEHPQSIKLANNLILPKNLQKNDVLIKVKAAALNPVDYKVIASRIPFVRFFFPHTVGRDFSGVIIEKNPRVIGFEVGDKVFGNAKGGALQEYTVARASEICKMGENIGFNQAAGLGLAGSTSLQALREAGIGSNSNILVIGASGGCGMFGVLLAKKFGGKVTGVCSGKNFEKVKKLKPDNMIDYTALNFLDGIKNEKFDIIYDTVTSPEDSDQKIVYKPFLKEGGKYVAINGGPLEFMRAIFGLGFYKQHKVTLLKWSNGLLQAVRDAVNQDIIDLFVDRVFEFNENDVREAFKVQKSRRAKGKIIIKIDS